jgi:DNA-binding IclR family transcriptional regulator
MGRGERILEILAECLGGLTSQAVAERVGMSVGGISSPLSKLVAYGYIRKTRDGSRAVYYLPVGDFKTR